jgi:hypothetical protein
MNRLIYAGIAFIVISSGSPPPSVLLGSGIFTRQTISEFYLAPAGSTNWATTSVKTTRM